MLPHEVEDGGGTKKKKKLQRRKNKHTIRTLYHLHLFSKLPRNPPTCCLLFENLDHTTSQPQPKSKAKNRTENKKATEIKEAVEKCLAVGRERK